MKYVIFVGVCQKKCVFKLSEKFPFNCLIAQIKLPEASQGKGSSLYGLLTV